MIKCSIALIRWAQHIFRQSPQPEIIGVWLDGRALFVDNKHGDDSNEGTIDSPFCSLQHAINVSDKDDRIFLQYHDRSAAARNW